jgi:pimeloyl-ACP methyl ester carboxylesterase
MTTSLAAAQDQFFASNGISVRYREAGSGSPVVLLHGYLLSLDEWLPALGLPSCRMADDLAAHHRVIAMDLRGFGQSTKLADSSAFGLHMADDVVRLLDHLQIEKAHIIGHSMGALIAANLASRHPARVRGVTLIAGPFYCLSDPVYARVREDLRAGKGLVHLLQTADTTMDAWTAQQASDALLASIDVASLIAVLESLPQLEITSGAPPDPRALIICGEADSLAAGARRLAQWWPRSILLVVPEADHMDVLGASSAIDSVRSFTS